MNTSLDSHHGRVSPREPRAHQQLIDRIVLGEEPALRELYDLLAPRAFAIALKVLADPFEAEEVLQDTFVEIWRGAVRFNSTRATADRWVVMLTRSRAIDRLHKRQARNRMLSAAAEVPFAAHPSTEELVATSQTRALVRKALA